MHRPGEDDLNALIENAAEAGARRVLSEIGLDNGNASRDIRDIRDLLAAWRAAKRTALQTVVRMITTAVLLALIAGLAIKLKLLESQ